MLDDFEPIVREISGDATIYPIGDLHIGSKEFNAARWEKFVDRVKNEPDSYIILVGDMINNAIKSSVSDIYEETMRPREQKEALKEYLAPIKDKIICAVGGNHENRSAKEVDDSPLYDVLCKLDIEDIYRDYAAFPFIKLTDSACQKDKRHDITPDSRPTYTFCVTHGSGGGMYIGSTGNKLERYGAIIDNLDCLVTGHTHRPLTFPVGKIYIDVRNNTIRQKQFVVVQATSWLNYGGYPIKKMLSPTAFALQEIRLSSKGKEIKVVQ